LASRSARLLTKQEAKKALADTSRDDPVAARQVLEPHFESGQFTDEAKQQLPHADLLEVTVDGAFYAVREVHVRNILFWNLTQLICSTHPNDCVVRAFLVLQRWLVVGSSPLEYLSVFECDRTSEHPVAHQLPDLLASNTKHPFERLFDRSKSRRSQADDAKVDRPAKLWKPVDGLAVTLLQWEDGASLQCDNCHFVIFSHDQLRMYIVQITSGSQRHFCAPCFHGYYVVRTQALSHSPFVSMLEPTPQLWCSRCTANPPSVSCRCGSPHCLVELCTDCRSSFGRGFLCDQLDQLGTVQLLRIGAPTVFHFHLAGPHTPSQVFLEHCGDDSSAATSVHVARHEVLLAPSIVGIALVSH